MPHLVGIKESNMGQYLSQGAAGLGSLPTPLPKVGTVPDTHPFVRGFMRKYGELYRRGDDHPFTRAFFIYARSVNSGPNYTALVRRGVSANSAAAWMLAVWLYSSPYIRGTLANANERPDPRSPGAQTDSYVMARMLGVMAEAARRLIR